MAAGTPRMSTESYEKEVDWAAEPLLQSSPRFLAPARSKTSHFFRRNWISIILAILLTGASVSLALVSIEYRRLAYRPYSPANAGVSYKKQPMFPPENTVFYGPPTDDQDAAWADLLTPVNVRITQEEMLQGNETLKDSVRLVDGDYVVVLAVFHELHCLNIMRRYLYWERYEPDRTEEEVAFTIDHLTHCVNVLRHFAMCHADVGMNSVEWLERPIGDINKQLKSNAESVCVDWQQFDDWARPRALVGDRYVRKPTNRIEDL